MELRQHQLVLVQETALCLLLIRASYQNLIPKHRREFPKIVKEGPLQSTIFKQEQAPMQSIFKILRAWTMQPTQCDLQPPITKDPRTMHTRRTTHCKGSRPQHTRGTFHRPGRNHFIRKNTKGFLLRLPPQTKPVQH